VLPEPTGGSWRSHPHWASAVVRPGMYFPNRGFADSRHCLVADGWRAHQTARGVKIRVLASQRSGDRGRFGIRQRARATLEWQGSAVYLRERVLDVAQLLPLLPPRGSPRPLSYKPRPPSSIRNACGILSIIALCGIGGAPSYVALG